MRARYIQGDLIDVVSPMGREKGPFLDVINYVEIKKDIMTVSVGAVAISQCFQSVSAVLCGRLDEDLLKAVEESDLFYKVKTKKTSVYINAFQEVSGFRFNKLLPKRYRTCRFYDSQTYPPPKSIRCTAG